MCDRERESSIETGIAKTIMVSPSSTTRRGTASNKMLPLPVMRSQQQRITISHYYYTRRVLPTFLALVTVVTWTSVLIAWMQSSLEHPTTTNAADTRSSILTSGSAYIKNKNKGMVQQRQNQEILDQGIPAREIELFPDNLQHEAFLGTLKSCLPAELGGAKCKQFLPDTGMERIGILRPPGALGFVFDTFVDEVIRLHPSNHTMDIIKTSHVPPYGYGKTHGYTKFIRLASMPLLLAASDVVLEQVTEGSVSTMEDITLRDVTQALRQVVRWHCRLSHVAAHTAIMTVTLEDLVEDPWEVEYNIRVFLNLLQDHEKTLQDHLEQEKHIDEDELAGSMDEIVHRSTLLLMRLDQLHRRDNNKPNPKIEDMMDAIVNDELRTTKNLEAWPCKSFWEFDDSITEVSKRTAARLSPNCTSCHCWVPRDLCEVQGDAKCVTQKGN